VLVWAFGSVLVDGGFIFSPARGPLVSAPVTDFKGMGRSMAEELEKALPRAAGPKRLEPVMDQPKEDEKEKETNGELLASVSMFNAASSENTEEQQAAEDALREAMASSSSQLGGLDRSVQETSSQSCLPDFAKCPDNWTQEGVLCTAGGDYSGRCAAEVDLSEMSSEQKLAFADFCGVKFPCQGTCEGGQDFGYTCPSLWREIGSSICQAPLEYEGSCSVRLHVTGMSEEEKYTWSVRCGARWPCAAPRVHNYQDACPKGWSLRSGLVCHAPARYNGPCEQTAYMSGAGEADKKAFEASCHVSWAELGGACYHDYTASCPFGWHSGRDGCVAPLMYDTCGRVKSFSEMTPAAKEDWAKMCKVHFPCRDRSSCEKSYSAPCPADWYAFNGGMSCMAPSQYIGKCSPVLHGLIDVTMEEKSALEGKCSVQWPCAGEIYKTTLQESIASEMPRQTADPAQHSAADGPIESSSGAIREEVSQ